MPSDKDNLIKDIQESVGDINAATGADAQKLSFAPPTAAPAASPVPTPTPAPINRSVRSTPEETPDFLADAERQEGRVAQRQINSLNDYASQQIEALKPRQEERERETSSISTLTGLGGSTDANVAAEKTSAINEKENQLVRAEAESRAQAILGNISTKAAARAGAAREQFTFDKEQEAAQKLEDVNEVATLAQSGINAEAYAAADPEGYQYLAESLGGEEMLKASFVLNRPVEDVLDSRVEGGKYVTAYRNPLDGKIRVESIDLGLPTGYSKTIDAGNRILAIPDDWDGSPESLITINKGLTPTQAASAARSSAAGGGSVEPSGEVTRDVDSVMNGTLNLQDISVKDNYRAIVAGEVTARVKEAEKSGDMFGVMAGSAAYDKEVSDSFLQSMEKTISVMGQLGVLQENIAGTDTGPIVGAFRGKNPWDTNAQTIKAQLNAIVPNLARGVYGEVGVLTDNDIRTYSKTIPTITSTDSVRDAVLFITIDMIKRNIETKVKTQAAGQRDMSKFAGIYEQVENTANEILGTIPGSVPGVPSTIRGGGSTLSDKVAEAGYDYEAMRAAGHSDEDIEAAINQ